MAHAEAWVSHLHSEQALPALLQIVSSRAYAADTIRLVQPKGRTTCAATSLSKLDNCTMLSNQQQEVRVNSILVLCAQGLELDDTGRVLTTSLGVRRMDYIAEQEIWAVNSDKKASEWVENMNHLGGKAMDNAGDLIETQAATSCSSPHLQADPGIFIPVMAISGRTTGSGPLASRVPRSLGTFT